MQYVTVKIQRSLFSSDGTATMMSYIVDEDDERSSNPIQEGLTKKMAKKLGLDQYAKVYWLGEYRKNKPVNLIEPTREDEWVEL